MVGGSTATADERGLSNLVGITILIGLVITGSVIVVTIGGEILDDVSSQTQQSTAQDSMVVASGQIEEMSGSSVARSTSFEIPSTLDGVVGVNGTGASVSITVRDTDNPSDSKTESRQLGTIYYRQDENTVALQGSGVWRQTEDGPVMLAQPSLSFNNDQLDLALTDFGTQTKLSKGDIVVTHDTTGSRTATKQMMQSLSDVWTDTGTDKVDVTITIESQFAQAWATYARNNLDGDVTVTTPSNQKTVLTFAELSAEPTTSPPITTHSTTSASASPPATSSAASTTASDAPSSSASPEPEDSTSATSPPDPETARQSSATAPDSDDDGVADTIDDCPNHFARGTNGCDVLATSGGSLAANAEAVDVTYLGMQSGKTTSETVTDETAEPIPRDVTFVIDETGSMVDHDCFLWWCDPGSDPNGKRNDAVRTFVDKLAGFDRAAAIQFSTAFSPRYPFSDPKPRGSARTIQSLTGNHHAVKSSLSEHANGGTDIAAGIREGISQHRPNSDRTQIMVVLSDGQDNVGDDPRTAAREAARKGIKIYSVGLGDEVDGRLGDVARITGGKYYHVDDAGGLEATFEEIEEDSVVRKTTNYYVDHDPISTTVDFGGRSWSPASGNVNHPNNVDPTDPYRSGSPPTKTFDIQPGSKLNVQTSYYACRGGYTESSVTQTHDGNQYTHRGCGVGQGQGGTNNYKVFTDGDPINTNRQWWQDLPALLPQDVSVNGGRLSIPRHEALVRVNTNSRQGYALYLLEGTQPPIEQLPVADLSTPDATVFEGDSITLDASGSHDPSASEEIVSYDWSSNVDSPNGETATTSFTDSGTKTVSVTVESSDGSTATTALTVDVRDRDPVAVLHASDKTPLVGEQFTIEAGTSYDPDAGDTIERYNINGNGWTSSSSTTMSLSSATTETVTLQVENSDGKIASTQLDVTAQEAPEADLTADKEMVYEGEQVTFTVDTDDTVEHWVVDGNTVHTSAKTLTKSWDTAGPRTVKAVVSKPDMGATATPTVTVDVENRAPVAEVTSDSTTENEASVTLDASQSHDVDPGDTLSWDYTIVDQPTGSSATIDTSGDTATLKNLLDAGVYRVEATVEDDDPPAHRKSASASLRITVREDNKLLDVSVVEMDAKND